MYTGIDYHKRFLVATTMNARGVVVRQEKVATDRASLEGFIARLPKRGKIAMEATGNWYSFYELLEDRRAGQQMALAHPLKTRAIAEAKIKTDKVDSQILAHLLRADLLPTAYIPPRETRDVREVLRYRASLVSYQTSLKNKVHAILSKNGIILEVADLFGKKARRLVAELPLRDCYRLELDGYLCWAAALREIVATVDAHIRTLVTDSPAATLLMTIPGIGYYSALLIISEIGDVHRFPSAKKLCSYAGLVPSVYSSGGKTRHGAITKQGSRWLRWILVELSHHFYKQDPRLAAMHARIARTHGANSAKVAIARHMLAIIYAMLRDNRPYRTG